MIVPILLLGLALILAYVGSRRQLSKLGLMSVAAFLGAGALMVLRPDLANRAAATLNVGRGADLLLYFSVLCGVLIAANFYFRFKQNEQVTVEIVRRLAFLTAAPPAEDGSSDAVKHAWVVIPAYQEASVLRSVVEEVRRRCLHVVVVDDGSKDNTADEGLAGGAIVLRHVVNLGQGAALRTGIDYALAQGAELLFTFDADGQHLPDSLAAMEDVRERTGADAVLGSRTLGGAHGIPAGRRLLLRAALAFTRMHARLPVTDTHNGLRLFTRKAALEIRISQARMAHASEILSQIRKLGLRFAEAPVALRYTKYSLAKGQKIEDGLRILFDIFYAKWTRG